MTECLIIWEVVKCPPCTVGDAEVMQPGEGAEVHPATSNRKELTSETDAAVRSCGISKLLATTHGR